jgi:hypothetical protein
MVSHIASKFKRNFTLLDNVRYDDYSGRGSLPPLAPALRASITPLNRGSTPQSVLKSHIIFSKEVNSTADFV